MQQDELKHAVALAAIVEIQPWLDQGAILGIGTGSTADIFIDQLASLRTRFAGAVASSERSAARLTAHGIKVVDLNDVTTLPVYVDGADEVNADLAMIKGGGGALTREKIVAAVAERFICIADASKRVDVLGKFPLPIEVIPMARAHVARQLILSGGEPRLRSVGDGQPFVTDNGNHILDVHGLAVTRATEFESRLNAIVGVVACGLFALRGADVLLLGTADGVVRTEHRPTTKV